MFTLININRDTCIHVPNHNKAINFDHIYTMPLHWKWGFHNESNTWSIKAYHFEIHFITTYRGVHFLNCFIPFDFMFKWYLLYLDTDLLYSLHWYYFLPLCCMFYFIKRSSWLWSHGSWIYNYLCNQCLSPLTLWTRIPLRQGVLETTLSDKMCQWFATGLWFPSGTIGSFTNKTDCHDIAKILLKVALNTITLT
jgi:hypothetical protein